MTSTAKGVSGSLGGLLSHNVLLYSGTWALSSFRIRIISLLLLSLLVFSDFLPIFLYNCGTWDVSSFLADNIDRAYRKMLRRVLIMNNNTHRKIIMIIIIVHRAGC